MTVLVLEDQAPPYATWRCAGAVKSWVQTVAMKEQLMHRVDECKGGGVSPYDGLRYTFMSHRDPEVIASYGPVVGPCPDGFDSFGRKQ